MTAASIITWIVFGLIVGAVASLLDPSPRRMGIVGSIALGILGAVLGGLIAGLFGFSGVSGFNLYSFVIALIGSLVVLAIGRSLYPGETFSPEYYDEELTNERLTDNRSDRMEVDRDGKVVEVETHTRRVKRDDTDI